MKILLSIIVLGLVLGIVPIHAPGLEPTAFGVTQSSVQQVSIYICGHYINGTAEWCW